MQLTTLITTFHKGESFSDRHVVAILVCSLPESVSTLVTAIEIRLMMKFCWTIEECKKKVKSLGQASPLRKRYISRWTANDVTTSTIPSFWMHKSTHSIVSKYIAPKSKGHKFHKPHVFLRSSHILFDFPNCKYTYVAKVYDPYTLSRRWKRICKHKKFLLFIA